MYYTKLKRLIFSVILHLSELTSIIKKIKFPGLALIEPIGDLCQIQFQPSSGPESILDKNLLKLVRSIFSDHEQMHQIPFMNQQRIVIFQDLIKPTKIGQPVSPVLKFRKKLLRRICNHFGNVGSDRLRVRYRPVKLRPLFQKLLRPALYAHGISGFRARRPPNRVTPEIND